MKIVLTGGGSGGHITPLLAVAHEITLASPETEVLYIGQRGDGLADVPESDPNIDSVYTISAGKFRRYHGEGLKQLLDVKTIALNVRDVFRILAGLWQSWRLLGKLKADIVFTRGGYVSVPVALAAKLRGIPYITHDSDSIPSLANRIIARWAKLHAVALPAEIYPYPKHKTVTVGVPVHKHYTQVTAQSKARYKTKLSIADAAQVLLVTGGGNGAHDLNKIVIDNAAFLLQRYPTMVILHIAGRNLEQKVIAAYQKSVKPRDASRVQVFGFVHDLYTYSGAADVIIARGGATNIAEFALQRKACVIIPSPQLVWNVRNTEVLTKKQAVLSLSQTQAEQELRVAHTIMPLLDDPGKCDQLGKRLSAFAYPDAAETLAVLLLNKGKRSSINA
jgi:UDP-N-acetylglucosamine--N-acetylmuramyl-(pentapeptide) pyrophosphoryl-undecaprenol N-acetylglucosamine transferase